MQSVKAQRAGISKNPHSLIPQVECANRRSVWLSRLFCIRLKTADDYNAMRWALIRDRRTEGRGTTVRREQKGPLFYGERYIAKATNESAIQEALCQE